MIPLSAGFVNEISLDFFRKNFKKTLANSFQVWYLILADSESVRNMVHPGVAKFGIALEWGSRGRWFESSHSDHENGLKSKGFKSFSLFLQLFG